MWLPDADATEAVGARLGLVTAIGDVIALTGPLGAGKTSFARGIIGALGFAGDVPSPTFGLVIPYAPPEVSIAVWHIDLYRIEGSEELDELGLDEARAEAALVIEWPDRMGDRLWADALRIELSVEGDGRRLTATVPTAWRTRWPLR